MNCGTGSIDGTSFYVDPRRFDLVTGVLSGTGPVDFYRKHAVLYGSPVLELACGTGRLSIPTSADGLDIVGLDASDKMLALAEQKASASGVTIRWVQGDMRDFDLGRQFKTIFIASNSFSHLYSRGDIESCLAAVRRHLAASGRFLMEVFNPALGMFIRQPEQRSAVTEYLDPDTRHEITVSKSVRYDSAEQISHEMWCFRDVVTGEERAVALNLRMFFPQEIDALMHYNSFKVEAKYGDYQNIPFDGTSRKQVLVCRLAGAPE